MKKDEVIATKEKLLHLAKRGTEVERGKEEVEPSNMATMSCNDQCLAFISPPLSKASD